MLEEEDMFQNDEPSNLQAEVKEKSAAEIEGDNDWQKYKEIDVERYWWEIFKEDRWSTTH